MIEGIRTIITANSIWKVDVILCRYARFSRHEAPAPDNLIPYTAEWEPYTALERFADRIVVHRPVPWGDGALRMTGVIEWDDLERADIDEADERH